MGGGVDVSVEGVTTWQSIEFKYPSGAASLSKCSLWQSSNERVCSVVAMGGSEVMCL